MKDPIERQDAIDRITNQYQDSDGGRDRYAVGINVGITKAMNVLKDMPTAEPEQKLDEWCTDCKEYDQKQHCCHRWNRVIRATMEEMKPDRKQGIWMGSVCSACGQSTSNYYDCEYCPHCGAEMRGE